MTLTAAPAVVGLGKPVTTQGRRRGGVDGDPALVPVIVPVTVSVAVIDWVPAVLRVTGEGVHPGVAGREGVVGRQDRLAVAAGEVDRAGVTGGRVAEGVLGRDRDVVRRPGRASGSGSPRPRAGGGGRALTVIPLWVPVIVPVTVSVAVMDWVPAVLSVTREGVHPGVAGREGVVGRQDAPGRRCW